MMNPIVIDPPNFDQQAAWKECSEYVEKCGGLSDDDGEVNWRAAFGADPGCCSCPACGEMYWKWGNRQRCAKCAFEYPTDWWAMYSYGCSASKSERKYKHDERMKDPYYRYGYQNPVEDPWKECHTKGWRTAIRTALAVPLILLALFLPACHPPCHCPAPERGDAPSFKDGALVGDHERRIQALEGRR